MFGAVIFDMDGVIIDSEPIYFEAGDKLFRYLGLDVSEEEHHSYVGIRSKDMWSHIRNKYKIDLSTEELVEMEMNIYIDYLLSKKDEKPIPGVVELIEDLYKNNIDLALASSSSIKSIKIVLDMFNLEKFFKIIVNGYEVENGKPAPDIFVYAAKRLGVQPEGCIVIEDSKNGIEAAKSAGMKCVGFKNLNSGKQDLSSADMVIDSFSQLNYEKLRQIFYDR
jgi:beta-phosphoglucomutase family hydrolase